MKGLPIFPLILLSAVLIFTITGCNTPKEKEEQQTAAADYLYNKYHLPFEYIKDDESESGQSHKVFKDEDGYEFNVAFGETEDGRLIFSDNYYNILYDEDIQKEIEEKITSDCKIVVDTSEYMFTNGNLFVNYKEYLDRCQHIEVYAYTKGDIEELSNDAFWTSWGKDLSITIYKVSEKAYEKAYTELWDTPITEIMEQRVFNVYENKRVNIIPAEDQSENQSTDQSTDKLQSQTEDAGPQTEVKNQTKIEQNIK